jgi:chromosome segregation ATPase
VEHERDELLEARRKLTAVQEQLAALERERDELSAARELGESLQTELDETQRKLNAVARERDVLRQAALQSGGATDRVASLKRECAKAKKDAESSLLETCDLRVKVNRLEGELDETKRELKRKTKKILSKIHEDLDGVGAPSGEDLSFGQRIRRLGKRIAGLEDELRRRS